MLERAGVSAFYISVPVIPAGNMDRLHDPGISSTLGGWIVTKQPNGHLVNFHWLGWIAVAGGLLSILLAHTVRMNDTGVASPLAPATKAP